MIKPIAFLTFSIWYWYTFARIGGSLPDGDPARRPLTLLFVAIFLLIIAGIAIYEMKDEPL